MLLDKTEGKTAKHTLFSVPSKNGKGILVSPTVHGNLIVGPNAYVIEDRDDHQTTQEGLDEILRGAKRLVPKVNERAVITSFSGVRPTPSTGDYYIKPSEQVEGLLHLAGIESPGRLRELGGRPGLRRLAEREREVCAGAWVQTDLPPSDRSPVGGRGAIRRGDGVFLGKQRTFGRQGVFERQGRENVEFVYSFLGRVLRSYRADREL
jgi:glycerol-3-phosphate dehydrogenase